VHTKRCLMLISERFYRDRFFTKYYENGIVFQRNKNR